MVLPLVLHGLADAEALAVYDWYAARDLAAAEKFRSAPLEPLDEIAERPELSPPFDGSLRRRLLHGVRTGCCMKPVPDPFSSSPSGTCIVSRITGAGGSHDASFSGAAS